MFDHLVWLGRGVEGGRAKTDAESGKGRHGLRLGRYGPRARRCGCCPKSRRVDEDRGAENQAAGGVCGPAGLRAKSTADSAANPLEMVENRLKNMIFRSVQVIIETPTISPLPRAESPHSPWPNPPPGRRSLLPPKQKPITAPIRSRCCAASMPCANVRACISAI